MLLHACCRSYERPGLLAKGEGLSAKMLFLYGATQTFRSPDAVSLAANSCFILQDLATGEPR